MGFKVSCVIMLTLSFYVVQLFALPRDSTAFQKQHETLPNEDSSVKPKAESPVKNIADPNIPGRIGCPYDEATEDVVCQEHCLPKGYSYGLCISNTCSCI